MHQGIETKSAGASRGLNKIYLQGRRWFARAVCWAQGAAKRAGKVVPRTVRMQDRVGGGRAADSISCILHPSKEDCQSRNRHKKTWDREIFMSEHLATMRRIIHHFYQQLRKARPLR